MGAQKTKLILTTAQARELKWFCDNVSSTRSQYYEVMGKAEAFDERLKDLEKTCKLINKFLGEQPETERFRRDVFGEGTSETPRANDGKVE